MFDPASVTVEPRGRGESFDGLVRRLNAASVSKHYDAYTDIPWDDPDYAIDARDPRWALSTEDLLGATAWYQSLPEATRAEIGLHQVVDAMKVGVIFEGVLSRGLLEFASSLPNGTPEFRYALHEVIEESQHSLMFQEFINRSGFDPKGRLSPWHGFWSGRVVTLGRRFPELFLIFVLGGEAPIDFAQRRALDKRANLPPILRRVMQIHVTEEARHLCFARSALLERVPKLPHHRKVALAVAAPIILREMAAMMLVPSRSLRQRYNVPDAVMREAFFDNPLHRVRVKEALASVRDLCGELGILNRRSVALWRSARLT